MARGANGRPTDGETSVAVRAKLESFDSCSLPSVDTPHLRTFLVRGPRIRFFYAIRVVLFSLMRAVTMNPFGVGEDVWFSAPAP